ncbi:MAG: DNA/RNA non-specific endonuclease [Cyanobacteria bacterium P01_H01_bin.119]
MSQLETPNPHRPPRLVLLLAVAIALLAGCSPSLGPALDLSLPPCVADDCNCGDFSDRDTAQRVLEAFPTDPYRLDRDGNGLACESLPAAAPPPEVTAPVAEGIHLTLGNPSQAGTTDPNNYLIQRQGYALGYSSDRGAARWASWQLEITWLGDTPRQDNFRPDGALPRGSYQVTPNDYRGSGYDRGHLVPSGDRTRSVADNAATFLMTNIIPQAPENNRGPWRALEEYCRDLVYQQDRELFIIAGAYGQQGSINNRVTVPSRIWKVVVILDLPGTGIEGVSPSSQIIAVDMPNRDGLSGNWQDYQTTVNQIEVATGLNLLSAVPIEIQAAVESVAISIP